MPMLARKIRVRGRVQGVNYRESLRKLAEQMSVTGWVRNRADGSVEAFVQGEPAALEDILQFARMGPPNARVDEIDTEEAAPDPAIKTFQRRETA